MSEVIQGAPSGAPGLSLEENEAIIEKGLLAFAEAGQALMNIRDGEQYKVTHSTFEAYLHERWQMSTSQAYRLIEAAKTAEEIVSPVGDTPPVPTERVARELRGSSKQKAEAWKKTVEKHGPNPTAEQTREVVEEVTGIKRQPRKKSEEKPKQGQQERSGGRQQKQGGEKKFKGQGDDLTRDEHVIEWVKKLTDAGWERDRIVEASKSRSEGWPVNVKDSLSNGAMTTIRRLLEDREKGPVRPDPEMVSRERVLKSDAKEAPEERQKLLQACIVMDKLASELWRMDVIQFAHDDKIANNDIDSIYNSLVDLSEWIDQRIGTIQSRASEMTVQRKIKALRNRRYGDGGTNAEVDTAHALADKLERKLKARLSA